MRKGRRKTGKSLRERANNGRKKNWNKKSTGKRRKEEKENRKNWKAEKSDNNDEYGIEKSGRC